MKRAFIVLIVSIISLTIAGCSKSNKAYEEMIDKGMLQLEEEEFVKAEVSFEMALEEKPKDEQASQLLKQTKQIQLTQIEIE